MPAGYPFHCFSMEEQSGSACCCTQLKVPLPVCFLRIVFPTILFLAHVFLAAHFVRTEDSGLMGFAIYPFSLLASLLFHPKSLSLVCTFWLSAVHCFHADELAAASRHIHTHRGNTHSHNTNMNLILPVVRIVWKSKSLFSLFFSSQMMLFASPTITCRLFLFLFIDVTDCCSYSIDCRPSFVTRADELTYLFSLSPHSLSLTFFGGHSMSSEMIALHS